MRQNLGAGGSARLVDRTSQFDLPVDRRGRAVRLDAPAKRILDASVATFLLLALSPLILVILLTIAVDGGRPLFYRARRVGFGGTEFPMLKFRKMKHAAGGVPLTVADDERFTRVGRFLAASKLDEIPQLWNVVKGQMSLVGPRPEDPVFVAVVPDEYELVTSVRPGVTGLTQLAFARESEILDASGKLDYYVSHLLHEKVRLDCLYVARRTFWMDIRILWWTAAAVLLRRSVAVHRQSGRLNVRRRPQLSHEPAPVKALAFEKGYPRA
jgi:lipopolysaccharide/colanic/teichoic acid biosynthesis glycosyltransferase